MTLSEARRFSRSSDPSVRSEAARVLSAAKARASRVKPKRAGTVAKKKATRDERNQRTAEIRAACLKRADGKCELCGQPDDPRMPCEMHHLLPGRGRRTQEQDVSNCVMVCGVCHMIGHGRILYVGTQLIEWARRYGYTEAEKVVRRRMDKALLADPSWPRDADETARLGPDNRSPPAAGGTR